LLVSIRVCRPPYLRQRSALTGPDLAQTSTVAAVTFSRLVKCLDFRCAVVQASHASDFDAQGKRAMHSARNDRGRFMA
jgi:hypothetical protein